MSLYNYPDWICTYILICWFKLSKFSKARRAICNLLIGYISSFYVKSSNKLLYSFRKNNYSKEFGKRILNKHEMFFKYLFFSNNDWKVKQLNTCSSKKCNFHKQSIFSIYLFPKNNIKLTNSVTYTHRYIDSCFISCVFKSTRESDNLGE